MIDPETGIVFSDVIEIHTIELPKLRKIDPATASLLDRWAYFLKTAEGLDTDALPPEFDLPIFHQAMETFIMIRENEESWLEYDAQRLKVLDERTRMGEAEETGVRRGRLMGRIQTLQQVLKLPVSADSELSSQSIETMQRLADELAQLVLSRQGGQ